MNRIIFLLLAIFFSCHLGAAQIEAGLAVTLPDGSTVTLAQDKLAALERHSESASAHG